MALHFEIIENEDYLQCVVSGEHDTHLDYKLPMEAVLHRCRNSDHSKTLFDYRTVTNYPGPADRIALLGDFTDVYRAYVKFGGRPLRFSFVICAESHDGNEIPMNIAKGMTIANNSKLDLMLTAEIDEAIAWLTEANAPEV